MEDMDKILTEQTEKKEKAYWPIFYDNMNKNMKKSSSNIDIF